MLIFSFISSGMDSLKGASLCIEEYNPRSDTWRHVATMTTRRLQFGVAVLDNKLYLTGKVLNHNLCTLHSSF